MLRIVIITFIYSLHLKSLPILNLIWRIRFLRIIFASLSGKNCKIEQTFFYVFNFLFLFIRTNHPYSTHCSKKIPNLTKVYRTGSNIDNCRNEKRNSISTSPYFALILIWYVSEFEPFYLSSFGLLVFFFLLLFVCAYGNNVNAWDKIVIDFICAFKYEKKTTEMKQTNEQKQVHASFSQRGKNGGY